MHNWTEIVPIDYPTIFTGSVATFSLSRCAKLAVTKIFFTLSDVIKTTIITNHSLYVTFKKSRKQHQLPLVRLLIIDISNECRGDCRSIRRS